jgi:hypothetical protein
MTTLALLDWRVEGATPVRQARESRVGNQAGKPDIDWDDPQAKAELVSALVNDALAVLAGLCGPDAPERDEAAGDALGLLALVAGQDVEPAEGSDGCGSFRAKLARCHRAVSEGHQSSP